MANAFQGGFKFTPGSGVNSTPVSIRPTGRQNGPENKGGAPVLKITGKCASCGGKK